VAVKSRELEGFRTLALVDQAFLLFVPGRMTGSVRQLDLWPVMGNLRLSGPLADIACVAVFATLLIAAPLVESPTDLL
jgi:hypothetical protein